LCGTGSGVQHVSAEDDGSTGDLLPSCTVQCVAGSDHQKGVPDYRFGNVLPAAV